MDYLHPKIISNTPIAADLFELVLPWSSSPPSPGRFATIRVSTATTPLLRRPFAFSGYSEENHEARIIFQKRGPATELLAAKSAGEHLDLIGPLGNGFEPPPPGTKALLVAGGIGLGPVLFQAERIRSRGGDCEFVFGARSKDAVPHCEKFSAARPVVCTDDGSEGFSGTVVDYLTSLPAGNYDSARLYCCGPTPMLRGCHEFAETHGLECFVSIEQVMACGVGACMGCAVKTRAGYARACTEGPVFNSRDLVWT